MVLLPAGGALLAELASPGWFWPACWSSFLTAWLVGLALGLQVVAAVLIRRLGGCGRDRPAAGVRGAAPRSPVLASWPRRGHGGRPMRSAGAGGAARAAVAARGCLVGAGRRGRAVRPGACGAPRDLGARLDAAGGPAGSARAS